MSKVRFFGRILPSICKVNLTLDPSMAIDWDDTERQAHYNFKIFIVDGMVCVECEATRYRPTFLDELYRRAFDLARATVDTLAFGSGLALTVILEEFEDPSGNRTTLLLQDPRLPPLVTAFQIGKQPPNNLQETLRIVWTQPPVFFALRDLIEAITLPHRAAVCCGRAVEGLRSEIAGTTTPRARAWAVFRNSLNLDETYLKLISDNSVGARHGDHAHIPGTTTVEITRRAWTIMDRFLHYRLRGDQPLPQTDFPLLVA